MLSLFKAVFAQRQGSPLHCSMKVVMLLGLADFVVKQENSFLRTQVEKEALKAAQFLIIFNPVLAVSSNCTNKHENSTNTVTSSLFADVCCSAFFIPCSCVCVKSPAPKKILVCSAYVFFLYMFHRRKMSLYLNHYKDRFIQKFILVILQ
jgi:hypothetical protein